MTANEAPLLQPVGPSRPAEDPGGWAVIRCLRRTARMVTQRGLRAHRSRAKTRDLRRVLLIEPPSGLGTVISAGAVMPFGLVAVAEALRATGFDAEIYDAMASLGLESIRLYMEHSYPHVVAAASYAATAESAREVLSAAKEVVPGVFTVLLGAQSALVAGKAPRDGSVDFFVGDDCADTLPGLLNRLRAGEQPGRISESRAA